MLSGLRKSLHAAIILLLLLRLSDACGKKGKKGDDGGDKPPPSDDKGGDDPLKGTKSSPYDNSGYDAKNGQATSPDDLKCDFEGNCCWKNTKPPYDTLDYAKVSGSPDKDAFKKAFGTDTLPSGNFLAVASQKPSGDDDKAELESCSIACANGDIKVTFKHWGTSGVKFQVCQVSKADPDTLLNCQDASKPSPGPDTVTLPPGNDISLVIVASKLTGSSGNAALIDDIAVEFQPCSSTTPAAGSTPPGTPGPSEPPPPPGSTGPAPTEASADDSSKACCDFSSGPCGYSKGSGPQAAKGETQEFAKAGPERFRNPATGVPPSPDKSFAAAYLKPKQNAYMETDTNFGDAHIIKFQEYKATQDVSLKACCDTDNGCSYDTGGKVEKGDFRQWYQGSVECPAGTKKVIFVGQNDGVNEGGIGIDNIEVYDKSGNKIC